MLDRFNIHILFRFCLALFVLFPSVSFAEKKKKVKLQVIHSPAYEAVVNRTYVVSVEVRGDWMLKEIHLNFRLKGAASYSTVRFLRNAAGSYIAQVESQIVTEPGIEYYIDSIDHKGKTSVHFGTEQDPYFLRVRDLSGLGLWLKKLERHGGNRSTLGASFDYQSFGSHEALGKKNPVKGKAFDYYYNMELWYSYRMLGFLYELTFGFGRLRGELPLNGKLWSKTEGTSNEELLVAGFDYGFSKLYMEFSHHLGVELKLALGASQAGFQGGVGATLRIGNLLSTHLDLGFDWNSGLGKVYFFELAWDTVPGFLMALRAEASTLPYLSPEGLSSKAYLKVKWRASQKIHIFGQVGYGRRRASVSGGALGKLGVSVHF